MRLSRVRFTSMLLQPVLPFAAHPARHLPRGLVFAARVAMAGQVEADPAVLKVVRVPCLSDNYSWLLHCAASGKTAVVDPAEVAPVVRAVNAKYAMKQAWPPPHAPAPSAPAFLSN
jgi:hypothetical protein